jgi:hypothetical protein
MPSNGGTPIVPDDDRSFFSQGMDKSDHISGQLEDVVCLDGLRPIGLAVATLIRSHHVKSCISERWYLMPPRIPALWETMTENDQRPLALLREVHLNAVGIHESVVY